MLGGESQFKLSLEQKEKNEIKSLIVYRIRHGETEYHEHTHKKELRDGECDITEKGRQMMIEAAKLIMKQSKKENTIFCVIASPRIRTQNGKDIAEHEFRLNGFEVLEGDPMVDKSKELIRNFDMRDENGEPLPPEDERYPAFFDDIQKTLGVGTPGYEERMYNHNFPNLESMDSIKQRTREELAELFEFARHVQSKSAKQIVFVQLEHGETLDDLYDNVCGDSMKNGGGAKKGEVVKLEIPTDSKDNHMVASFMDESREPVSYMVKFDPEKREFET